jgi:hypothetical protein
MTVFSISLLTLVVILSQREDEREESLPFIKRAQPVSTDRPTGYSYYPSISLDKKDSLVVQCSQYLFVTFLPLFTLIIKAI